jgi:hypothetical protein
MLLCKVPTQPRSRQAKHDHEAVSLTVRWQCAANCDFSTALLPGVPLTGQGGRAPTRLDPTSTPGSDRDDSRCVPSGQRWLEVQPVTVRWESLHRCFFCLLAATAVTEPSHW